MNESQPVTESIGEYKKDVIAEARGAIEEACKSADYPYARITLFDLEDLLAHVASLTAERDRLRETALTKIQARQLMYKWVDWTGRNIYDPIVYGQAIEALRRLSEGQGELTK
jgi:hypothetical protein